MSPFLPILLSAGMLTNTGRVSPARIQIRLESPIGSYASRPGSPIRAVVIAPFMEGGKQVLPPGTILAGNVKAVRRIGLGLVHETAALTLDFNRVVLRDGGSIPITAKVAAVDNGREQVSKDGRINGVRTTRSVCYRVGGYLRTALFWEFHAGFTYWAIKTLVTRVPEPEIYYRPGTEMALELRKPLTASVPDDRTDKPQPLDEADKPELADVIEKLPKRTTDGDRPSDIVNVLLLGSREQITKAFVSAGWVPADAVTTRSRIRNISAAVQWKGYPEAPMSKLLLKQKEPDMLWQKGLNDVSKRHHIRLWKQPETWHGQEIWTGAATRDIHFAYLRPGHVFSHKIDPEIDREREKVAYDLAFTSCADTVDWSGARDVPTTCLNGTGDIMKTDTRMAIVVLNDCAHPLLLADSHPEQVPMHGSRAQRLLRREILSFRSDFIRTNPYWRSYEGARWIFEAIRNHKRSQIS